MGECYVANNEDPRFNERLSVDSIRALIAENNTSYPVWGWKEPSTHTYFNEVSDLVRTPFFIAVYRNILGSASSKRKHTEEDVNFAKLAKTYATHYVKISGLLKRANGPCFYVKYNETLSAPLALAGNLSERLRGEALSSDMSDRIARYCTPGEYKSINDFL
ncbi:hypothetical protein [Litoreibacter halocynthiae]|uniref:hypothetical protein n=1 Tax=Litoreibacter halocynthiae TaxID=1242689 RepID=UPI00249192B6|nr:hypothetical protein [Litoreibacter halocynthiae]